MTLTAFPTLGLFFPNTRKSRPGNFRSVVLLFFFPPSLITTVNTQCLRCVRRVWRCAWRSVTGSSGLIVPPATARHHEEGLKRGAAETVDGIKVPGREGSVLAGKGKRLEEEAPNARGFSEPGFPASGAGFCLSVCLRAPRLVCSAELGVGALQRFLSLSSPCARHTGLPTSRPRVGRGGVGEIGCRAP